MDLSKIYDNGLKLLKIDIHSSFIMLVHNWVKMYICIRIYEEVMPRHEDNVRWYGL
jgi:hypothetical protein